MRIGFINDPEGGEGQNTASEIEPQPPPESPKEEGLMVVLEMGPDEESFEVPDEDPAEAPVEIPTGLPRVLAIKIHCCPVNFSSSCRA